MDELSRLFEEYRTEAFRLELLPQYKVEGEWENFEIFLSTGNIIQDNDLKEYLKDVDFKITAGAKHIRARVLENPPNSYQIFETQVGYIPSYKLGTELYFINRSDFEEVIRTYFKDCSKIKDFWLFDNKDVVFFNYDNQGQWLGYEIGSKEDLKMCVKLKSLIIERSFDLMFFLEKNDLKY